MNPHTVFQRLNTDQAAAVTGRHRNTIHKALEAGELHGSQRVKYGRWSIRPECLDKWLDGHACTHQEAGSGAA